MCQRRELAEERLLRGWESTGEETEAAEQCEAVVSNKRAIQTERERDENERSKGCKETVRDQETKTVEKKRCCES